MIAIDPKELDLSAREAVAKVRIAEGEQAERQARKARRDAIVAMAASLPNPEVFAQYLPARWFMALEASRVGPLGWRVDPEFAEEMRPWGLVAAGTGNCCLTAYGLAVRRVVMSWSED